MVTPADVINVSIPTYDFDLLRVAPGYTNIEGHPMGESKQKKSKSFGFAWRLEAGARSIFSKRSDLVLVSKRRVQTNLIAHSVVLLILDLNRVRLVRYNRTNNLCSES